MTFAICLRCGDDESAALDVCKGCSYDPHSDPDDLIKSVYLSTLRFEDEDEGGDYVAELKRIGMTIRAGHIPDFDEYELARLKQLIVDFESVRSIDLVKYLLKLFLKLMIPCIFIGLLLRFIVDMLE